MADPKVWSTIHAERRALADNLEPLRDEQWSTPSLCDRWAVRDVVAHLTATAKIAMLSFLGKIVGAGFSLERMQAKDIAAEKGCSPTDTLARFKAVTDATTHPPGPIDSWLGEVIVHAEDVRRPLGIAHTYPTEAVVRVADFYKRSNLVIGVKRRIAGLRLRATDASWSHGDGPEVSGPILSLLMAMTGRHAAIAALSGDGVATLSPRP